MKIIKTVATRSHILRLNAPNSISAGAPLDVRGPTSKVREGRKWERGKRRERKGEERGGEGREGEDPLDLLPWKNFLATPLDSPCSANSLRLRPSHLITARCTLC